MKKAVIYGAGNIGRGFIGQLLSLSGYEVVFLDINHIVIDRLNKDGCYPLKLVNAKESIETIVENVRGVISADSEAASNEFASSDISATAVGAGNLSKIAPVIALGLAKRWQSGNLLPFNIIICENLADANKVLEKFLLNNLDEAYHTLFRERVGLVEASIGRMVPTANEEMQLGNPLSVWAEPYSELPVDRNGFKGELPDIVGLIPFSPFEFHVERKLYMHNMSHAMLAYLGYLEGYEFIWQAARQNEIAAIVKRALTESAAAISNKHRVPMIDLRAFADNLMERFNNPPLKDTVDRVGRDTVRKLAPQDRLVGAASLCLSQGVQPENISAGIAAALLFSVKGAGAEKEISAIIKANGLQASLDRHCGIRSSDPLYSLVMKHYTQLTNR